MFRKILIYTITLTFISQNYALAVPLAPTESVASDEEIVSSEDSDGSTEDASAPRKTKRRNVRHDEESGPDVREGKSENCNKGYGLFGNDDNGSGISTKTLVTFAILAGVIGYVAYNWGYDKGSAAASAGTTVAGPSSVIQVPAGSKVIVVNKSAQSTATTAASTPVKVAAAAPVKVAAAAPAKVVKAASVRTTVARSTASVSAKPAAAQVRVATPARAASIGKRR